MHLLEVGLILPPETFLRWKLEGLARRGSRVTVAGTSSRRPGSSQLAGVEVVSVPDWDEPWSRLLPGLAWGLVQLALRDWRALAATVSAAQRPLRPAGGPRAFARRLRSYLPLARIRPDVVHFEWNPSAIHYLPMAEVWRCPTVVSCHGVINLRTYRPDDDASARWLRLSFDVATAVHCVSEAVAEVGTEIGMDPRRACVIRTAVDPEFFRPALHRRRAAGGGNRKEPLRIVTVSNFRWLKGIDYAVRAVALASRAAPGMTLEIIGGDPADGIMEATDRHRVEHTIERCNLGDRVTLAGALSSEAIRDRLQQADVLLHTSLTEGLPTAVLEGMACGLPAVVTACGGVTEAVRHRVEGLVVPPRDVEGLAEALVILHDDEGLRRRLGRAARARVKRDFGLNRQIDQFLRFYEAITDGPPASLTPEVAGRSELRILTVAPLSWTQGVDDTMQAISVLLARRFPCRLRVIGRGAHQNALWFTRGQLGLERHVEFRDIGDFQTPLEDSGQLADASLLLGSPLWRRQFEWCDVVLDASLRDPPHAVLAAALALGTEVISTSDHRFSRGDHAKVRVVERGAPHHIAAALEAIAAAAGTATQAVSLS